MSEMQWLVGVGRRVLYHYERRGVVSFLLAELLIAVDGGEQLEPCLLCYHEVEESLHHVECGNSLTVVCQILSYLLCRVFGFLL